MVMMSAVSSLRLTSVLFVPLLVVCVARCGGEEPMADPDAAIADAAPPAISDAAAEPGDAARAAPDVGSEPPPPPPPPPTGWSLVRLQLDDGEVVEGELLHVYNENLWWDRAPRLRYLLFDPDRFVDDYRTDQSMTLVTSDRVVSLETVPASPDRLRYRDWLRARGWHVPTLPLDGIAYVLGDNGGYHVAENGWGDFAWDFSRTDAHGARFRTDGATNEDYRIWDQPVRLPRRGLVVEIVDDVPDNTPGETAYDGPNNLIGIHLGGAYYLYVLHLREGSIPDDIAVGDVIAAGTVIGRAGNAGVTLEPHIHLTALWYDAPAGRSWSVPIEFADVYVSPTPVGPDAHYPRHVPEAGTWISGAAF